MDAGGTRGEAGRLLPSAENTLLHEILREPICHNKNIRNACQRYRKRDIIVTLDCKGAVLTIRKKSDCFFWLVKNR